MASFAVGKGEILENRTGRRPDFPLKDDRWVVLEIVLGIAQEKIISHCAFRRMGEMRNLDQVAWWLAEDWVKGTLLKTRTAGEVVPVQWPKNLDDARLVVEVRRDSSTPEESESLARLVQKMAAGLWPDVVRHGTEG